MSDEERKTSAPSTSEIAIKISVADSKLSLRARKGHPTAKRFVALILVTLLTLAAFRFLGVF